MLTFKPQQQNIKNIASFRISSLSSQDMLDVFLCITFYNITELGKEWEEIYSISQSQLVSEVSTSDWFWLKNFSLYHL